ncbi:hypothetical protein BCAR13_270007 [Paraburkholderia caribensis]|nr:hypothetical protein BCAR13_270007 [Paraburkholderia caribensis]
MPLRSGARRTGRLQACVIRKPGRRIGYPALDEVRRRGAQNAVGTPQVDGYRCRTR